jgi:protein-disulfide isomerase
MRVRALPILVASALLAGVASIVAVYAQKPEPKASVTPAPVSEPLAEVDGVAITREDVDSAVAQSLSKLQEQIYTLRRTRLDALIDDRLLSLEAKRRGVTTSALIDAEITAKAPKASDAEIAAFYETNKGKLQGELAQWQEQIRTYLNGQRVAAARAALLQRLRGAADVKIFLEPVAPYRADVKIAGAPVRGNPDAPVTIVEFSDFHCPFCRQVQPVLGQLMAKYGDRVRIVYKDMPLDSLHPQGRAAAEASRCAAEQGRFWEFHDQVYGNPVDGSPATLQRFAQQAGLDVARFEACRSARKYQQAVQNDVQEGTLLGITGTPGFFINGRFLSGSQPLDTFARIFDEELAARTAAAATSTR